MGATRTQIYLTADQRRKLDARCRREHKTLAAVIRDAIEDYLHEPSIEERQRVLDATFGIDPEFTVPPRSEWDRGYG